ncbi:hypothetical protein QPL79_06355 [Ignisphaera sp. 4213-co]|uniref:Cobalt ECF transporter T component CbiQ n=1 Tax=Ignisphaera cupida TaxID=3050454 RepID=A0ABD4Z6M5_9CREN|nr:hypothetical protein [Ignisphaera sp. 4213-co]MDK6028981.1 hypothetical protein [Ignisphaera sp. 4213-co]
MSFSKVFSRIVLLLLRSLFLYGFVEARKGSTAIQLAFTILSLYITIKNPVVSIPILAAISTFYIVFGIAKALAYAALVSLVPATWMGLTNLLYTLSGKGLLNPASFIDVFMRAEIGSLIVFTLIHTLNISELCYLVSKFSTATSLAIEYFWRIASQLLKESSEMLYIHGLKKEKTWKTLAMLFIRGDEIVTQFSEGVYLKQFRYAPKPIYSRKTVLAQITLAVFGVVAFLWFAH